MAFTISRVSTPTHQPTVFGNMHVVFVDLTFDNSYPTGGESFVADDIGLRTILYVSHVPVVGGFPVVYDYTNGKFLAYDQSGVDNTPLNELDNAVGDLNTLVMRVMVIGV